MNHYLVLWSDGRSRGGLVGARVISQHRTLEAAANKIIKAKAMGHWKVGVKGRYLTPEEREQVERIFYPAL